MKKLSFTLSEYLIMKSMLYSIVLFFLIPTIQAQDVAICGWDGSATEEVAFVLLRDFAAGEVIYFTEDEYVNTTGVFNSGEGHIAFTVPAGGLLENDVIIIEETGVNVFTVNCASGTAAAVGSGAWSFSNADEIYAYSASNPLSPWTSVTEVHCFAWFSNTMPLGTQDPTADYPNCIYIAFNIGGGSGVNANFNDVSRVNTTLVDLQNGSNWTQSSGAVTLTCTDFTNHMLPVELVGFKVEEKNKKAYLNWSTATEINNDRFEVEHSKDGEEWRKIGSISGNGNSVIVNNYGFIHEYPNYGINYYRLKQIDYDGQFEYSKVISVNLKGENGEVGEFYPNPSKSGLVNLDYHAQNDDEISVTVFDLTGKLMVNQIQYISRGDNNLSFDFSYLNTGLYIVKVGDERNPTHRKLIIEK